MICARCQTPLKDGRAFCTICGYPSIASENYAAGLIPAPPAQAKTARYKSHNGVRTAKVVLRGYILGTCLAIAVVIAALIGLVMVGIHGSHVEPTQSIEEKPLNPPSTEKQPAAVDANNVVLGLTNANQAPPTPSSMTQSLDLKPLQFQVATEEDMVFLRAVPPANELLNADFKVAHANLCPDGPEDLILLSTAPQFCGSGGCEALVIEKKQNGYVVLLNQNLPDSLAVTQTVIDGCHSLAAVDGNGRILLGDQPDTPLYGKELIYSFSDQ